MNKLFALLPVIPLLLANGSCEERAPSGASIEAQATRVLQDQAATVVGMPAVKNFAEKRQLKTIYELRDNANLVTYTYSLDMNGKRHKVCPTNSVGFGIPYATQYTAPKAMQRWRLPSTPDYVAQWGTTDAEQPEPNGLYMPSSADGTWIICVNPVTKELAPTYVEPRVVVYLFEMPSID